MPPPRVPEIIKEPVITAEPENGKVEPPPPPDPVATVRLNVDPSPFVKVSIFDDTEPVTIRLPVLVDPPLPPLKAYEAVKAYDEDKAVPLRKEAVKASEDVIARDDDVANEAEIALEILPLKKEAVKAYEALTAFKTYDAVEANEALVAADTLFTVNGKVLPSPLVNVKVALDTDPVTINEPVFVLPPPLPKPDAAAEAEIKVGEI